MELQRQDGGLLGKKRKRNSGFRINSKSAFLTYPRCDVEKQDALDRFMTILDLKYAVVSRELHSDGFPHLHALVQAKKKMNVSNSSFFDIGSFHGNYQSARDTNAVRDYVMKADSQPLEFGVYESNKQSDVQKRAVENKRILDVPLTDLVDDGTISIYSYTQLKQCKDSYNMDRIQLPSIMDSRVCYWIWGEPGIGKTYWVRSHFPDAYPKSQNKWWDGYLGQDVVLLDDFDCSVLGHNLKIWADKYSFNAEIKGGTVKPVYSKFIVTSNYWPEQVFKDDSILAQAVSRRFIMCSIDSDYDLVKWGTGEKLKII